MSDGNRKTGHVCSSSLRVAGDEQDDTAQRISVYYNNSKEDNSFMYFVGYLTV
jgi:hypothetical protein